MQFFSCSWSDVFLFLFLLIFPAFINQTGALHQVFLLTVCTTGVKKFGHLFWKWRILMSLDSTSLNYSKQWKLTRGTFRQVPTRRIRTFIFCRMCLSRFQIFAICYIILEVYNGFRCRKGWQLTLEKKSLVLSRLSLLFNDNIAWSFVVFVGKLVQVSNYILWKFKTINVRK